MPDATDDALSADNRRAKRDSLFLLTDLFDESGQLFATARIRNLSATGLMAECAPLPEAGDHVTLTLRGAGEIGAVISWVRDGRVGMRFDREIDPLAARRPIAGRAPAPPPVRRFSRTLR